MKGQAPDRVRRVSVTDPLAAGRYDYADAFELRLEGPDRCSPEEWVRAGVDATPAWIKRIAGARDGLGSARIVESDADLVVLEDSDPLMDTVMVGRNVEPERRMLTTVLRYRRPLLARAVWAFVGILHRRTARQVVAGALRPRGEPSDAVEQLDWFAKKFGDDVADRIIITSGHDAYRRPDGIAVIPAALLGA
jgi:hypothetical protein